MYLSWTNLDSSFCNFCLTVTYHERVLTIKKVSFNSCDFQVCWRNVGTYKVEQRCECRLFTRQNVGNEATSRNGLDTVTENKHAECNYSNRSLNSKIGFTCLYNSVVRFR